MSLRWILLACALVPLIASANNPAYWTARYGGWSKEHHCELSSGEKRCWTLTLGKDTWHHEVADLSYTCRTDGEEWLSFGFRATIVVNTRDSILAVRWDSGHEEPLATHVDTGEYRGKPMYWFSPLDAPAFAQRMDRHEHITVTLPVRGHQGRYVKAKFPMRNAIRSIGATMRDCGIESARSALGRLPQ